MPLVSDRHIAPGARLSLWRIDEAPDALEAHCAPDDIACTAGLGAKRRRERLAWRALLQAVSPGAQAVYDGSGAPSLADGRHIGVSHTGDYAAVILSDRPCAVDMERLDRDFSRSAPRFLAPGERALPGAGTTGIPLPALVWCAKETLFKLKRREGVDLLNDIRITAIDSYRRMLVAEFRGESVPLHYCTFDNLCVVYGLE